MKQEFRLHVLQLGRELLRVSGKGLPAREQRGIPLDPFRHALPGTGGSKELVRHPRAAAERDAQLSPAGAGVCAVHGGSERCVPGHIKRLGKQCVKGALEGARQGGRVDGLEPADKVGRVRLLRHVDHRDAAVGESCKCLHCCRLARARLAHQQHWLVCPHADGDALEEAERVGQHGEYAGIAGACEAGGGVDWQVCAAGG